MKKAISLIELVLAMSVIGVIMLATTNLETTARRFLSASDRVAQVMNEANYVMDHIQKYVCRTDGYVDTAGAFIGVDPDPPFINATSLSVNIDEDNNPADFASDTTVTYSLNGNAVEFDDGSGAPEVISSRATLLSFDSLPNNVGVQVTVRIRFYTWRAVDPKMNPEVELVSNILFGQHSAN